MKEVLFKRDKNLESPSRRKAVKTVVGGVTALAAYNLLPAKWGTPYIESVFLPAHAATSATDTTATAADVSTFQINVTSVTRGNAMGNAYYIFAISSDLTGIDYTIKNNTSSNRDPSSWINVTGGIRVNWDTAIGAISPYSGDVLSITFTNTATGETYTYNYTF